MREPARRLRIALHGEPHPQFDEVWYLEQYGRRLNGFADPYANYLRHAHARDPNPLFGAYWYVARHGDDLGGLTPLEHYTRAALNGDAQPTPLFDFACYRAQLPRGANVGSDLLLHFMREGWREGLNPNWLFDTNWYLRRHPDVARAGENPLVHYVVYGAREGRQPHPLFDGAWYREQNRDVAESGINPLSHYLEHGARERRDPHPLFACEWYRRQNPELSADGFVPLRHYLAAGWSQTRDPHPLFQTTFYVGQIGAKTGKIGTPLAHYLDNAERFTRPNEFFDGDWYLNRYPDVRAAGVNALVHYAVSGARDGRDPSPRFSTGGYLSRYPDIDVERTNPLGHYLRYGREEGRSPAPPSGGLSRALFGGSLKEANAREARSRNLEIRYAQFLRSGARLVFPRPEKIELSILLVFYNAGHQSFACLESLRSCLTHGDIGCEVIIHDNGSVGVSRTLLDRLDNVVVRKSDENLGFIGGANAAAAIARGQYLLFLNNDTEVTFGSMEAALAILRERTDVGAVGGKLILPDGSLQEAGDIVWRDGSCLGYCRGEDPEDFQANFQRDVDYCSGAFLMTRRALFETCGPFNPIFAPGYYEETDYCLTLWERGHRVVYDPRIAIFHHEFGSAESRERAQALQERNKPAFVARHRELLAGAFEPTVPNRLWARSRPDGAPRVLVIDDLVPHQRLGSGFPRARAMLNGLARLGAHVTLLPTNDRPQDWATVRDTLDIGIEVAFGVPRARMLDFIDARRGYYDSYIVSRPHNMEPIAERLDAQPDFLSGKPLIYDAEALFCEREIRQRTLEGDPPSDEEAASLIASERAIGRWASTTLSVSERDRRALAPAGYRDIRVLSHRVEARPAAPGPKDRRDILFVGAIHADSTPNADSVVWFIDEALPPFAPDDTDALPLPDRRGQPFATRR